MENEKTTTQTNEPSSPTTAAAAPTPEEVLATMQATMVPKAEAEKWQEKYNSLFQSVANGQFSGANKDEKAPTEEELKAAFLANVKALNDYSTPMPDKENIKRLLDFDAYLTAHGRRSAFASSDSLEDARKAEQMRAFLNAAAAQETEGQVAVWTAEHLDDDMGFAAPNNLFGR